MKARAQLATQQEADLSSDSPRLPRSIGGDHRPAEPLHGRQHRRPRQQESMRCCIEAVDLVLSSHEQFREVAGDLGTVGPVASAIHPLKRGHKPSDYFLGGICILTKLRGRPLATGQSFVIWLAEHPAQAVIGGIFVAFAFFAIHVSIKCAQ